MSSFIRLLFVSVFVFVSALAVPLESRDAVAPPVTNPNASTTWTVGSTQLVVWDTSTLPPYGQITNKVGQVVLGFLDGNGENLMLDNPLAKGFNITQGTVQVVVPDVPFRTNYIIVLMGNSGNASPQFTITGSSNGTSPSSSSSSSSSQPTPTSPDTTGSTPALAPGTPTPTPSPSTPGVAPSTSGGGAGPTPLTGGTSAPVSASSTTLVVQTTGPATSTSTKSNGASSVQRFGVTGLAAALIISGLLL